MLAVLGLDRQDEAGRHLVDRVGEGEQPHAETHDERTDAGAETPTLATQSGG